MNELAIAYINYLAELKQIKKPRMPKFNVDAYNDNNYKSAIDGIMLSFDCFDDFVLYEEFLKGDHGS